MPTPYRYGTRTRAVPPLTADVTELSARARAWGFYKRERQCAGSYIGLWKPKLTFQTNFCYAFSLPKPSQQVLPGEQSCTKSDRSYTHSSILYHCASRHDLHQVHRQADTRQEKEAAQVGQVLLQRAHATGHHRG